MSKAVQGVSLKKPQYLTMKEWYDLTETCFQSSSCMRTRKKLNLLRNMLNFFALKEHCDDLTWSEMIWLDRLVRSWADLVYPGLYWTDLQLNCNWLATVFGGLEPTWNRLETDLKLTWNRLETWLETWLETDLKPTWNRL